MEGDEANVKYFHIFGSACFVLANKEPRKKLDGKGDEAIFLGYTSNGAAFRVFNKRTKCIMESRNVVVDDEDRVFKEDKAINNSSPKISTSVPDDVSETEDASIVTKERATSDSHAKKVSSKVKKNHASETIIGNLYE